MSLGWKGGDSSRSGRATGVNDVVLFKGLGSLGKEMTRLTRTDHHGTDPRNSSSLCSCPSRAHRRLSAHRQHLHTDPTACLPTTAAALESQKSSTGRDSPLPHPPALPCRPPTSRTKPRGTADGSILIKKTPAQPRCRRVHGQPHAGNLQLVSLSLPRRSQDASSSSRGNILAPWTRKVLPAAAFSHWFERREGCQLVVSYLHAVPRVNWLT